MSNKDVKKVNDVDSSELLASLQNKCILKLDPNFRLRSTFSSIVSRVLYYIHNRVFTEKDDMVLSVSEIDTWRRIIELDANENSSGTQELLLRMLISCRRLFSIDELNELWLPNKEVDVEFEEVSTSLAGISEDENDGKNKFDVETHAPFAQSSINISESLQELQKLGFVRLLHASDLIMKLIEDLDSISRHFCKKSMENENMSLHNNFNEKQKCRSVQEKVISTTIASNVIRAPLLIHLCKSVARQTGISTGITTRYLKSAIQSEKDIKNEKESTRDFDQAQYASINCSGLSNKQNCVVWIMNCLIPLIGLQKKNIQKSLFFEKFTRAWEDTVGTCVELSPLCVSAFALLVNLHDIIIRYEPRGAMDEAAIFGYVARSTTAHTNGAANIGGIAAAGLGVSILNPNCDVVREDCLLSRNCLLEKEQLTKWLILKLVSPGGAHLWRAGIAMLNSGPTCSALLQDYRIYNFPIRSSFPVRWTDVLMDIFSLSTEGELTCSEKHDNYITKNRNIPMLTFFSSRESLFLYLNGHLLSKEFTALVHLGVGRSMRGALTTNKTDEVEISHKREQMSFSEYLHSVQAIVEEGLLRASELQRLHLLWWSVRKLLRAKGSGSRNLWANNVAQCKLKNDNTDKFKFVEDVILDVGPCNPCAQGALLPLLPIAKWLRCAELLVELLLQVGSRTEEFYITRQGLHSPPYFELFCACSNGNEDIKRPGGAEVWLRRLLCDVPLFTIIAFDNDLVLGPIMCAAESIAQMDGIEGLRSINMFDGSLPSFLRRCTVTEPISSSGNINEDSISQLAVSVLLATTPPSFTHLIRQPDFQLQSSAIKLKKLVGRQDILLQVPYKYGMRGHWWAELMRCFAQASTDNLGKDKALKRMSAVNIANAAAERRARSLKVANAIELLLHDITAHRISEDKLIEAQVSAYSIMPTPELGDDLKDFESSQRRTCDSALIGDNATTLSGHSSFALCRGAAINFSNFVLTYEGLSFAQMQTVRRLKFFLSDPAEQMSSSLFNYRSALRMRYYVSRNDLLDLERIFVTHARRCERHVPRTLLSLSLRCPSIVHLYAYRTCETASAFRRWLWAPPQSEVASSDVAAVSVEELAAQWYRAGCPCCNVNRSANEEKVLEEVSGRVWNVRHAEGWWFEQITHALLKDLILAPNNSYIVTELFRKREDSLLRLRTRYENLNEGQFINSETEKVKIIFSATSKAHSFDWLCGEQLASVSLHLHDALRGTLAPHIDLICMYLEYLAANESKNSAENFKTRYNMQIESRCIFIEYLLDRCDTLKGYSPQWRRQMGLFAYPSERCAPLIDRNTLKDRALHNPISSLELYVESFMVMANIVAALPILPLARLLRTSLLAHPCCGFGVVFNGFPDLICWWASFFANSDICASFEDIKRMSSVSSMRYELPRVLLSEVKAPQDVLSEKQLATNDLLLRAGFCVQICYAEEFPVCGPQEKNVLKKINARKRVRKLKDNILPRKVR